MNGGENIDDHSLKVLTLLGILAIGGFLVWNAQGQAQTPVKETKKETATPDNLKTVGEGCPSDQLTSMRIAGYESVIPTDETKTQVGSSAEAKVYTADKEDGEYGLSALDTVTLSSSGLATSTSGSEIECGNWAKVILGKDTGSVGDYYYTLLGPKKATGSSLTVDDQPLHKIGNVEVEFSNSTDNLGADTTVDVTMSAGETNNEVDMQINEIKGDTFRKPTVCFDYDNTNIDEVTIPTAEKISKPDRLSTSNGAMDCYKLNTEQSWDYDGQTINFPGIANYQSTASKAVKLITKSTASASTYTLDTYVLDEGSYIQNGNLKYGYEDETDSNVGAPDWTAADISLTVA